MGWLAILIGVVASALHYQAGAGLFMWLAIAVTFIAFWSWGIMHNHATEVAKRRPSYRGGFYDFTPAEADSVPNWPTSINLVATIACLGLLIYGFFR